jgi:hypothetical protein
MQALSALEIFGSQLLGKAARIVASVALLVATAAPSRATDNAVVFYLNEHYSPVIRLDRLPSSSASLKALLALYALQNGAGCEGKDDSGRVNCALTRALGLGANCSDAHLKLVRSWFDVTPNLTSRWSERWNARTKEPGSIEDLCYRQPDTAGWQNIWEILRIKSTGDSAEVEAVLNWGSQFGHGRVRYRNSYKIGAHTIVETSSQVTELSSSTESIFGGGKE